MRHIGLLTRFILLAILFAGVAWGQSGTLPLGEIVKQPKPAKKAARVVTDDDMPARPAPETPAAKEGDKAHDAAGEAADDPASRIQKLKDSEAAQEQLVAEMEEKLKQEELSAEQRQAYSDSLEHSKSRLESVRKERETMEAGVTKSQAAGEEPKPEESKAPESKPPDAKPPE